MSNSALASRATAVRKHIWDGDHFRPLNPTAPFQPQPCFGEESSTTLLLQLQHSAPKLLPRREAQWILTPTGIANERLLAHMSRLMLGSWETLISSVDEQEVTEILPNPCAVITHNPYPTEVPACHEVEEEQNPKDTIVSLDPKECPVSVKPKAKCVTDISRDSQTSSTLRTVHELLQPNRQLGRAGRLSYLPAEECLRKMLVNVRGSS